MMETTERTPLIAQADLNNTNNNNNNLPSQHQTQTTTTSSSSSDDLNEKAIDEKKDGDTTEPEKEEEKEDLSHRAIFFRAVFKGLLGYLIMLLFAHTLLAWLFPGKVLIDPISWGVIFFFV